MNRLSLMHQQGALRSYFPDSTIIRHGETELIWIHTLTPTPLSNSYKIKLHYKATEGVNVYVLEPKLALAKGKLLLPHVYSTAKQQLCLYYPDGNEFHNGMFYVRSIIPWTSEWLYHYEIWVSTGKWHGGGIDHETAAEMGEQKKINASKLLM
ncbi:MAG: hypothetical protein Q8R50_15200 [Sediminibacterium sp.]|nr:hypothetical protein [Sediminibacterium sp.]